MTTETKELIAPNPAMSSIQSAVYDWPSRWWGRWRNRVYMTVDAKIRLAQIQGWIVGLWHSGQQEFANALAQDLEDNFSNLGPSVEMQVEGWDAPVKLPNRKILLHDDRAFNSFSFLAYQIVTPEVYNSPGFNKDSVELRRIGDSEDGSTLTETLYLNEKRVDFFYKLSYNGGLIYHGPGAGETFSVSIGRRGFWQMHT